VQGTHHTAAAVQCCACLCKQLLLPAHTIIKSIDTISEHDYKQGQLSINYNKHSTSAHTLTERRYGVANGSIPVQTALVQGAAPQRQPHASVQEQTHELAVVQTKAAALGQTAQQMRLRLL
jgi:hypothetical protein